MALSREGDEKGERRKFTGTFNGVMYCKCVSTGSTESRDMRSHVLDLT